MLEIAHFSETNLSQLHRKGYCRDCKTTMLVAYPIVAKKIPGKGLRDLRTATKTQRSGKSVLAASGRQANRIVR